MKDINILYNQSGLAIHPYRTFQNQSLPKPYNIQPCPLRGLHTCITYWFSWIISGNNPYPKTNNSLKTEDGCNKKQWKSQTMTFNSCGQNTSCLPKRRFQQRVKTSLVFYYNLLHVCLSTVSREKESKKTEHKEEYVHMSLPPEVQYLSTVISLTPGRNHGPDYITQPNCTVVIQVRFRSLSEVPQDLTLKVKLYTLCMVI